MKNTKNIALIGTGLALALNVAMIVPAFAQTNDNANGWQGQGGGMMGGRGGLRQGMKPGIAGTVSAISGNSITVQGMQGLKPDASAPGTPTTYTVDASNAIVKKNGATSTVASITVGDRIFAQGTVNGTTVVATDIRDGMPGMRGDGKRGPFASSTSMGNGQPVIAGKIASINGSTLTVSNASNVTYTVDASNAKVFQGQQATDLSKVAVGDTVIVQGVVNNTAVTASSITDKSNTSGGNGSSSGQSHGGGGFFSRIGQFFMHLFGF